MTTESQFPQIKPSELLSHMTYAIERRLFLLVVSRPGLGKSAIARQAADQLAMTHHDFRLALREAVDMTGIPTKDKDGYMVYCVPRALPRPEDGPALLHFDEFNRARPDVQNACLQLLYEPYQLNEYQFDIASSSIVLSCNFESDGGGVQKLIRAAGNRLTIVELVPDLTDWCNYAIDAHLDPFLIAYHRFTDGSSLSQLPGEADANGAIVVPTSTWGNYGTPRQWERSSDIVWDRATMSNVTVPKATALNLVQGTVGIANGTEYIAYREQMKNMPSTDGIIMNPDTSPVPNDPGVLYALSGALARKAGDSNWRAIITYAERMPDEFNWFTVKDAVRRDDSLTHTTDFINWNVKHEATAA